MTSAELTLAISLSATAASVIARSSMSAATQLSCPLSSVTCLVPGCSCAQRRPGRRVEDSQSFITPLLASILARYSDRMTLLETALERIVAVAQPDRVILFGSVARGEAGPQSDLDFLVIKRGVTSRRRLAQAIYRALVGVPASIDIVVVTPEDVDALKHGVATIIGPAVREGREVYAA